MIVKKQKKNSKKRKIREIKSKKKEIKKEKQEPETLETNIEEIESHQFHESLQPIQTSAPVLTRIETSQNSLESNITSSPMTQTQEKDSDISYSPKESKYSDTIPTNYEDDKKYESEFQSTLLTKTKPETFRQQNLISKREVATQSNIETNVIEQKQKDPFETQEEKYKRVEF